MEVYGFTASPLLQEQYTFTLHSAAVNIAVLVIEYAWGRWQMRVFVFSRLLDPLDCQGGIANV